MVFAAACGGGDDAPPPCNPVAQTGCDAGLVCEARATGGTICAPPISVEGHVYSLATGPIDGAIEGARVVALNANTSPISTVAITAADGSFSIRVPTARNADGTPVATDVLLRADASGYRTFPSGVQQYFPVSTASGAPVNGVLVVSGAQTEIGLEAVPAGTGTASIHGTASVPTGAPGVLVVAEGAGAGAGVSALADRDGDYAIYNLSAASYTVKAFARGAIHTPQSVTLADGQDATVDIPISGTAGATVSGSANIVNPGLGAGTSVILVVESTFNEVLVRGETPPGLRAPQGLVPDLKGSFSITGVPPGRYVALAAFENDHLVRDPDLCQGGTALLHFDVPASGPVDVGGFKITGSLDVLSPGAAGPETVTTTTPTFSWVDDSSEDAYELTVVDSLGHVVWAPPPFAGSSGTNPSVTYAGPVLTSGYYQFKVRSSKGTCTPSGATAPVTQYLSATEDLKGVFVVP
jgi:hypothetical protein